jgi:hypothetical protein
MKVNLDALQTKFNKAIKKKHERKTKSILTIITISKRSPDEPTLFFNHHGIKRKHTKRPTALKPTWKD